MLELNNSESIQKNRNKVIVTKLYLSGNMEYFSTMQKNQEEFKDSSSFYWMAKTVAQIFVRFVFSIEVRYRNFDTFGVKPRVKLKLTCY